MQDNEDVSVDQSIWTPAPSLKQMNATIDIGPIGNQDLIATKIKVGRYLWVINLNINGDQALIQSLRDYRIPDHFTDPDYKSAVKELERAVAYMRAAVTFAFETPTKRGFESFIGQMDMFFPSTYALPTDRYRLNEESLAVDLRVLADIGRKYSIKLHRLLEFWRRGFELGELWYYSESYLNYFKILELMAKQIKVGSDQKFILLRDRFNTPEYKKRYGFKKEDVYFAAKIFAFWGNKKTTVAMFKRMCKIAMIRNNNVGHTKQAGRNGFYSATGQFSDDFDITNLEGLFVRELTRMLILNSLGYKQYWLDGSHGPYMLKLVS